MALERQSRGHPHCLQGRCETSVLSRQAVCFHRRAFARTKRAVHFNSRCIPAAKSTRT